MDVGAQGELVGGLELQVGAKRLQRGEPEVPRRLLASALVFEPVEEGRDGVPSDVVEGRLQGLDAPLLVEEAEELRFPHRWS